MSDTRIHLMIYYYDHNKEDWNSFCEFRIWFQTIGVPVLIKIPKNEYFKIKIEAIEALMLSLVEGDHEFCIHFNRYSKIECNKPWYLKEVNACKFCGEKQIKYDSKLKVTFGPGTWLLNFSNIKIIKEPLDLIYDLCDRIGVEVFYE